METIKGIDFRFRPPYGKYLNCPFYNDDSWSFPKSFGVQPTEAMVKKDMDLLFKEMDENNVGMGVVPVRKSWGLSNYDLVELVTKYPNRFRGVAGLEPYMLKGLDLETCYKEIDEFVVNGKLSGVALDPGLDTHPWYVDDKQIFPLYEKLQAENVLVLFTYGGLFNTEMSYYDPMKINVLLRTFPI